MWCQLCVFVVLCPHEGGLLFSSFRAICPLVTSSNGRLRVKTWSCFKIGFRLKEFSRDSSNISIKSWEKRSLCVLLQQIRMLYLDLSLGSFVHVHQNRPTFSQHSANVSCELGHTFPAGTNLLLFLHLDICLSGLTCRLTAVNIVCA